MKKTVVSLLIGLVLGFALHWLFATPKPAETTPAQSVAPASEVTEWTCSMHPQIRQPKPGQCPICGMDLIPVTVESSSAKAGPRELTLSPEARKLAEIEVAPVERKLVTSQLRLVGKIAADETKVRDVVVLADGVVERLYVNFVGVPVKQGDHLAEFYSPEVLAAAKELLVARDAARAGGSSGILESARRKLELLGVTDAQIEETLKSGKAAKTFTIFSPGAGVLTSMGGHEGHWLSKGEHLGEITDLSTVWVLLDAYESDLSFIRYGQQVTFTVEALPGRSFTGSVSFIPPNLDEMTRTVKVRLNAPNPDGLLRPGMFVRATVQATVTADGQVIHPEMAGKWISPMHPEIVKDAPGTCDICGMPLVSAESLGLVATRAVEPPLVIPATAPLITGKRAVVYVQLGEGRYEGREIELGPRAGDYYVVLAGLREGEQVVVRGNFKIDSSLQIQGKPSMMSPEEGRGAGGEMAVPVQGHRH